MFNIFSCVLIYVNWSLGNNCLFLINLYVLKLVDLQDQLPETEKANKAPW